jgi:hypothetical protein
MATAVFAETSKYFQHFMQLVSESQSCLYGVMVKN